MYTIIDLIKLREMLEIDLGGTSDLVFFFYQDVIEKLKEYHAEEGPRISTETYNELLKEWVKRYHEQPGTAKQILTFLFEVEYEDIPLYLNDSLLQSYVKWRIKIGK